MNEKWFSLPISEIEKKLKTNAASGLSRKAARSRLTAKNGALFSLSVRSPISYLGELVADFAYVMLMIMSFLALCFGETEVGIVTTALIVLNLAFCFVVYYRSQFFCDSVERLFLPRCKVVRDGRLYSVNATDVVKGDVIILQKGDIVPADARLVTSNNLRVKMLVEKDKYVMLDKASESRVYENELDPERFSNMVHAASVVLDGSARAIVTDVGQYTYVGAKIGSVDSVSSGRKRVPKILMLFKKYAFRFGIISMIAVLPFSIVSMLVGDTTLTLTFITAIAAAATSMAQLSLTVCKVFYVKAMRKCISSYEPSVVRSVDVMDKLAYAKYLFILDGAIATDGVLHFEKCITVEGSSELKEGERIGSVEKRLGELSALYGSVQGNALSLGTETLERYNLAIKEFVDRTSADKSALGIRCNITGFTASAKNEKDPHDRLFYSEFGEKYMLSVSYTDSIISECDNCLSADGLRALAPDEKKVLRDQYIEAIGSGKSVAVLSLCRHDGQASFAPNCFVGMLVLSESYDVFAKETIKKIEAYGLKPIFFNNITVEGKRIVANAIRSELAGEKRVTLDDFVKRDVDVKYGFGKISSYDGLSDRHICELIDAAHSVGERVAVCGFDERFERVYSKSDVLISFSSDEYKVKGSFEEEISILKTHDDPTRAEVSEMQRRRADVLIPRPNKKHRGGCESLLIALGEALSACVKVSGFFRYVVCMQFVRLILVMVPMLFGSSELDARHLVFGGMIADVFVLFAYLFDNKIRIGRRPYDRAVKELSSPIEHNAMAILCFGTAALLASLLPELLSFIPGIPICIDKSEYLFVVFVLFHLVVYLCFAFGLRFDNLKGIKDKLSRPAVSVVAYPIFIVTFCLGCFLIPYFSVLFDLQGFSTPLYLFVAFLSPVIGVIAYFFFGSMKLEFKKKKGKM